MEKEKSLNNDNLKQNNGSKVKLQMKEIWEFVKYAVIALALVIPIRMFIAQPFIVSGESMVPNFHNGEYLIVDELSYLIKGPSRLDVVIFKYPKDKTRFFIKRIIGMPNEKIVIKDSKVTIYNEKNPEGFALEEKYLKEEKFYSDEEYVTGDNEYFVLGDNRNQSSDSRVWGKLDRKLMVGRAFLRLLPIKDIAYLPGK
jgi:signal peptidase I